MANSAPQITEKQWAAQVKQLAKMFNWRVYATFLSKWSEFGYPDLTLVRERVVFVELKRQNGKLTTAQEEWLQALRDAGCEVYIWRPSDFDKVAEVLR